MKTNYSLKRMPILFLILVGALSIVNCSGSKLSTIAVNDNNINEAVKIFALSPSGGLLADAIGVELFNRGYTVIDTVETSTMLLRLNLSEAEVLVPTNLAALGAQGIDAYLSARSAAGPDGQPQSASVRVNSTRTGAVIAGVSWQNGWGGQSGSIADRIMRQDLAEVAVQITDALESQLK